MLTCQRRAQCDGARPMCGACAKENSENSECCEYSVREGTALEAENYALRELVEYLCLGPEEDAWETFQRLRAQMSDSDPRRILQNIRDARNPPVPTPIPLPGGQDSSAVERDALARSEIRVPARPWTSVAGDGIVSSLISAFFKWDEPFAYAYIARDLFLRDMRRGVPPQAKYCSPLLVNALCAIRSVSAVSVMFAPRLMLFPSF